MYFKEKDIADLRRELATIPGKTAELIERYAMQTYSNDTAKEFAQQGFMRRVSTLQRCIENVFGVIGPEQVKPPGKEVLQNAEINIQAFVLSTFGAIDNLAWIWIAEKNVTKKDGSKINQSQVGLQAKHDLVRSTFSQEFRNYLASLDDWFKLLEGFRDGLAHRIPLYIPPHTVVTKDEKAYLAIEARMSEASARHEHEEYDRLSAEQNNLKGFRPWMLHSFIQKSKPIMFHPQLLADFNLIRELGLKMLKELDP